MQKNHITPGVLAVLKLPRWSMLGEGLPIRGSSAPHPAGRPLSLAYLTTFLNLHAVGSTQCIGLEAFCISDLAHDDRTRTKD